MERDERLEELLVVRLKERRKKRWKKAAYWLFIALFTLVVAELCARIYLHKLGKTTDKKFRFNSYRVYEHVPGFHEGDGKRDWIVIDKNGFRRTTDVVKKKPAGTYRIFLMGASAAHGISSAAPYPVRHIYMDETIDAYLEKKLSAEFPGKKIEVINAAVTGYRVFQHTSYILSELLDYQPDMIIFFDGANDHYANNPQHDYYGDFIYQFWKDKLQEPSFKGQTDYTTNWMAESNSALLKLYTAWRLKNDAISKSAVSDVYVDPDKVKLNTEQRIARYKEAAPVQYLRAIQTNIGILKQNGIVPVIALQPMLVLRNSDQLSAAEKGFLKKDDNVSTLYPYVQADLAQISAADSVPFVDMIPAFNDARYKGKQLFIDYCHLTPEGGAACADQLFRNGKKIIAAPPVSEKQDTLMPPKNKAMEFLRDLWNFLKVRKKWWLAPLIIVLLAVGLLIVFGGGSAIAPFIYTLF